MYGFLVKEHIGMFKAANNYDIYDPQTGQIIMECREERRLQRLQKQLQRLQLLVIDELGYVPFSKIGAQLLFEVVGRAYEQQSLMITTNLPFQQWTEVFGSERLTGAQLDRLTHRCHIIEANGES